MYNFRGWWFPDFETHFQTAVGDFPHTWYQQGALDSALKYVKKFNVAVDIGANIGLHSVRLSRLFKKVYAFEPSQINFDCLENNLKNCDNVELLNLGLSNTQSKQVLKWPKNSHCCGEFSMVDFTSEDTNSEIVNCVTLDSFNLIVDFIKIDTQGFESLILEGSDLTLKNKPVLLIETESLERYDEVKKILIPLGYKDVATIRKKDHIWVHE